MLFQYRAFSDLKRFTEKQIINAQQQVFFNLKIRMYNYANCATVDEGIILGNNT